MLATVIIAATALSACGHSPTAATPAPTTTTAPLTDGEYSYGPDAAQKLDLHVSAGRPLVILIHGGGWIGGDKRQYETITSWEAVFRAAGYSTANLNYRLTGPSPAMQDLSMAVDWLQAKGALTGGYIAVGHSAGGHLAAMLCAVEDSRCRGFVGVNGFYDLTIPLQGNIAAFLVQWFGCDAKACPQLWRNYSPALVGKKVPALVFRGALDDLSLENQSTAARNYGAEVVTVNDGHNGPVLESRVVTTPMLEFAGRLVR